MSSRRAATARIGRVTPRAVSHTSSKPTTAAPRPTSRLVRLALWLCASRRWLRATAGACSTLSGSSSNTCQGAASGIGVNGWATRSRPSATALSMGSPSLLSSRLLPASRPAALAILTWPWPSNSSRRPSRLSCCRLARPMSRPTTPTTLPCSSSGRAMLVISTWRPFTSSRYGSSMQVLAVSCGQVSQRFFATPLLPMLASPSIDSGMASSSKVPGRGCDQYSEKRPLSLLPIASWPRYWLSGSRVLGWNTRYRPITSGLPARLARAWRVSSARRSLPPRALSTCTRRAKPLPYW
ncbi:hypothetical protein D3C78_743010 [compost metagenome]